MEALVTYQNTLHLQTRSTFSNMTHTHTHVKHTQKKVNLCRMRRLQQQLNISISTYNILVAILSLVLGLYGKINDVKNGGCSSLFIKINILK